MAAGLWTRLTGDVLGSNLLGVFSIYAANVLQVDIFFIGLGSIMVLLGLWGCCGAKKESKCLLIMVRKEEKKRYNYQGFYLKTRVLDEYFINIIISNEVN